jgi:hypothetical protein
MHLTYLNDRDMKAIDDLKSHYGGAGAIAKQIEKMRSYRIRKDIAVEKGYGAIVEDTEQLVKPFPNMTAYRERHNIPAAKPGIVTSQVSGWQGCRPTYNCVKSLAKDGSVLIPAEMISVMALTDDYVYNGDLLTTLLICENIMGASKFCAASLVGTPLPPMRFDTISKVTGVKIETVESEKGLRKLQLKNQGTVFGNLAGVEVANDDHLVYIDSITRTAMETGANFFLNPSWSTIVAACYYGRDIPNISFKISMLLAVQNTMQLRMLINIIEEYLREDGSTPVYEINLGNGMSPEKFMECRDILKESGLDDISLAAHIRINPDLGMERFNWFDNAVKVLENGYDITIKYESDGESRPYDTMEAYFISKEEREAKADVIGDVIYHKCVRCDRDARAMMQLGHEARFAQISMG